MLFEQRETKKEPDDAHSRAFLFFTKLTSLRCFALFRRFLTSPGSQFQKNIGASHAVPWDEDNFQATIANQSGECFRYFLACSTFLSHEFFPNGVLVEILDKISGGVFIRPKKNMLFQTGLPRDGDYRGAHFFARDSAISFTNLDLTHSVFLRK